MQNQTTKQIPKSVREAILARGGVFTEYKAVKKLKLNETDFTFFDGSEQAENLTKFAKYNMNGKNPLVSGKGTIFGIHMALMGQECSPFNMATGGTYAGLTSAHKFMNNASYTVTRDRANMREGLVSFISNPLPQVLTHEKIGAGVVDAIAPVTLWRPEISSLEENNRKNVTYLPIEIQSVGTSTEFKVKAGYSVDANLENSLLVMYLLAVDFTK